MKTYILRAFPPVERQTRQANPPVSRPKVPSPSAPAGPVLFVGLNVHSESIAACLTPSDSTELRPYGLIGGSHDQELEFSRSFLEAKTPGGRLARQGRNSQCSTQVSPEFTEGKSGPLACRRERFAAPAHRETE